MARRRSVRHGGTPILVVAMAAVALALPAGCIARRPPVATVEGRTSPATESVALPGMTPPLEALDATVTIQSVRGSIVLHYSQLDVTDGVDIEGPPEKIRDLARLAFGSMLETVSVETDDSKQLDFTKFLVRYRLKDCPVLASQVIDEFDETGFIPPLTQYSDTPLGRDWMSPDRFRALLLAYSRVTDQPFGALQSYATAKEDSRYGATLVKVDGRRLPLSGLWVISPGARSFDDPPSSTVAPSSYDRIPARAFLFYFPADGSPQYLGTQKALGEMPSGE